MWLLLTRAHRRGSKRWFEQVLHYTAVHFGDIVMKSCNTTAWWLFAIPYSTLVTSWCKTAIPYNTLATSRTNSAIPYSNLATSWCKTAIPYNTLVTSWCKIAIPYNIFGWRAGFLKDLSIPERFFNFSLKLTKNVFKNRLPSQWNFLFHSGACTKCLLPRFGARDNRMSD